MHERQRSNFIIKKNRPSSEIIRTKAERILLASVPSLNSEAGHPPRYRIISRLNHRRPKLLTPHCYGSIKA